MCGKLPCSDDAERIRYDGLIVTDLSSIHPSFATLSLILFSFVFPKNKRDDLEFLIYKQSRQRTVPVQPTTSQEETHSYYERSFSAKEKRKKKKKNIILPAVFLRLHMLLRTSQTRAKSMFCVAFVRATWISLCPTSHSFYMSVEVLVTPTILLHLPTSSYILLPYLFAFFCFT